MKTTNPSPIAYLSDRVTPDENGEFDFPCVILFGGVTHVPLSKFRYRQDSVHRMVDYFDGSCWRQINCGLDSVLLPSTQ